MNFKTAFVLIAQAATSAASLIPEIKAGVAVAEKAVHFLWCELGTNPPEDVVALAAKSLGGWIDHTTSPADLPHLAVRAVAAAQAIIASARTIEYVAPPPAFVAGKDATGKPVLHVADPTTGKAVLESDAKTPIVYTMPADVAAVKADAPAVAPVASGAQV